MVSRLALAAIACVAIGGVHAADTGVVGYAAPDGDIVLSDGSGPLLSIGFAAWGPKWAWTGAQGPVTADGAASVAKLGGKMGGTGVPFTLGLRAQPAGARQLVLEATLASERDTDVTLVALTLDAGKRFHGADTGRVTEAAGERRIAVPFGKAPVGTAVTALRLSGGSAEIALGFGQPTAIHADGVARIVLANGSLAAAQPRTLKLTIDLPGDLTWYPTAAQLPADPAFARAFPWQPGGKGEGESVVSLAGWLDAPAGRHGRIAREGDRLLVGGKPASFWGMNNCYATCAPEKDLADRRAAFYAAHGVNAVRLHKYADGAGWAGIQAKDSFAKLDEAGLARMDYYVAKLKERGIYVKLSPAFGVKLGHGDREAVPYLDEFGKLEKRPDARVGTGHGSIFLSTELQDLQIQQTLELLKHRNPHTGLTYAEDPAVMVIELFNEDSALFYGTMGALGKPTLRKRAAEAFCDWLAKKYGDEAKLLAAWGPEAIDSFKAEGFTGESFAKRNIAPAGNPWFFDPAQLAGSQKPKRARLLDTMRFLYETQNAFYARYVKALRDAGYQGEILASNWHAGRAMSHFYNLHSDWLVGLIDRHNYHGGTGSMLARAGSSILSSGLQQAGDRPFMLSEWISVFPNEWGAEGPAIIGAYGMGLQGWDVSFMFQNRDEGGYADRVGKDQWEITVPHVMAMFPAVSRQVLRGDVKQATVEAPMHVHVPSLMDGRVGFDDSVAQEADIKSLDSGAVPARALAAARTVVRFGDAFQETKPFDLAPYLQDGAVVSSTRQLRWTEAAGGKGGWFSIDTPGTQAVVGFAEGVEAKLADATIAPKSPFAALYLTAVGRDETLANAKRVLVTALARSRNTGMKVMAGRVLDKGGPPVLIEPVQAVITLKRAPKAVHACDHDGRRTPVTLKLERSAFIVDHDGARMPVDGSTFTIDTAEHKAIWYDVVYE